MDVVERIAGWVEEARKGGATLLCGGKALSPRSYAPTVLLDPPAACKLSREEVFGPVVALYTYRHRTDAVDRANGVPFAFQASIYTKDLDTALDTAKRLKAATCMVNQHPAFRVDWMPFGGYEKSGVRLGGIPNSMADMSREKLMVIKSAGA
jgi:acyl-CoA reductase-like NAD-dependent aldehyde dehydrogenase